MVVRQQKTRQELATGQTQCNGCMCAELVVQISIAHRSINMLDALDKRCAWPLVDALWDNLGTPTTARDDRSVAFTSQEHMVNAWHQLLLSPSG